MDEVLARKAEVGLHVWNLQGYAQAMILGNPEGPFGESATAAADSAAQVEELQLAMSNLDDGRFAANEPVVVGGRIDWAKLMALVMKLLPIILPLIMETE